MFPSVFERDWRLLQAGRGLRTALICVLGGGGFFGCRSQASDDGGTSPAGGDTAATSCPQCSAPTETGQLASALRETSGLVASMVHPAVYFGHNDSGHGPVIFAIDASGALLSTISVSSASAVDWEDIARGPCVTKPGSCLYIADIGDNLESRSDYVIYRVPEPTSLTATQSLEAEAFPIAYPDGSHDAETLLVHPETAVVTIVTKRIGGAAAYEVGPLKKARQAVTAVRIGDVVVPSPLGFLTGGDVRPDGRGVLLRSYIGLYFYPATPDQSVARALQSAPCEVPFAAENQGESVAWKADGTGYLTASEGVGVALHVANCNP